MPPELNADGDPVPTSPLSNESVEALLDPLLSDLEAHPENCDIFMSVYKAIQVYIGTQFEEIAQRKSQAAIRIHGAGVRSIFNHTGSCPMYVDAPNLFKRRGDSDN